MKRQPILAIDVGATAMAWAIGQPRLDQSIAIPGQPTRPPFELLGWGTVEMEQPDWSNDPAMLAQTIECALKEAVPDRALVCLTHPALSHHRVTTQIDVADEPIMIRARDLERLRSLAVTQAMSMDHELLCLEALGYAGNGFSGVTDPEGLTATRLRGTFHLVTMPLSVRRALRQALEFLGIELEGLTYRPKALVAGGMLGEGRGERVLLIDGDGVVCEMALVDQRRLVKTQTNGEWRMGNAEVKEIRGTIESFLHEDPPPSRVVVTGRISLLDGIVERIEQAAGVSAVLGRSPWAKPLGDLSRQVAASPVLGMLAVALDRPQPSLPRVPSRLIDRLLTHTKHLLVEYF